MLRIYRSTCCLDDVVLGNHSLECQLRECSLAGSLERSVLAVHALDGCVRESPTALFCLLKVSRRVTHTIIQF